MFDLGHVCELIGQRIKIEGPPAETGLWMAPVLDPTQAVKITRIISNSPSRIECVPVATGYADNHLEIRTRYSGTNIQLLQPRTITSNFTISRV
jgi:hypothetical protein